MIKKIARNVFVLKYEIVSYVRDSIHVINIRVPAFQSAFGGRPYDKVRL